MRLEDKTSIIKAANEPVFDHIKEEGGRLRKGNAKSLRISFPTDTPVGQYLWGLPEKDRTDFVREAVSVYFAQTVMNTQSTRSRSVGHEPDGTAPDPSKGRRRGKPPAKPKEGAPAETPATTDGKSADSPPSPSPQVNPVVTKNLGGLDRDEWE